MTCWALVPIKSRADCKSRLAGSLSPAGRLEVVREMARRVLAALDAAPSVERVAVVTPERDSLPGNVLILEDPGHGLNAALDAARRELVARGARELVVLHADLPLVTVDDIELLVAKGRTAGFALATDVESSGTNALFLGRPAAFRFRFGADSRRLHLEEAARLGLCPEVVRTTGLEFDLDRGEDLGRLSAVGDAGFSLMGRSTDGGTWLSRTQTG